MNFHADQVDESMSNCLLPSVNSTIKFSNLHAGSNSETPNTSADQPKEDIAINLSSLDEVSTSYQTTKLETKCTHMVHLNMEFDEQNVNELANLPDYSEKNTTVIH